MNIESLETRLIEHPLSGEFHPSWGPGLVQTSLSITLVILELENGIRGYGALPTSDREGKVGIETFLQNELEGMDVFSAEKINKKLRTASLRMTWPWGVELAVWDAIGKTLEKPVYKLWGGYQDKIKVYASLGEVKDPEIRSRDARELLEKGFSGIKLRFGNDNWEKDIEVARKVHDTIGEEMDIMVDANQADILPGAEGEKTWDYYDALEVGRALEELGVSWLEEPLPRFAMSDLQMLNNKLELPLAGGEKNQMMHEFKQLIEEGCYDIIQGDAAFSEGLFQLRKIAGFAEMHHKKFVPHTWCNCITLFGNLQLAASLPNCPWFEFPWEDPGWTEEINSFLFKENLKIEDGYINVPKKPGLGFEIDTNLLQKFGQ